MIKKFAIIKDNKVDNVILIASENYQKISIAYTNQSLIELEDNSEVGPGWSYYDGNFVNEIPQPPSLSEDDISETVETIINDLSNA